MKIPGTGVISGWRLRQQSAIFLLACLAALDADGVRLEDIRRREAMSGSPEKQRRKSAYIQKCEEADRKKREAQQHQDKLALIAALRRIPEQLSANEKEQDASDKKRRFREWLTIILLTGTVITAGIGDKIFYKTEVDAGRAWLAPYGALPTGRTQQGNIQFNILFGNTGKGPALDLHWNIEGDALAVPRDGDMGKAQIDENRTCDGLQPSHDGGVSYPFIAGEDPPSRSFNTDKITAGNQQDGKYGAYVRGCVAYRTMGVVAHSRFCFMFRPLSGKAGIAMLCPNGNWAE